MNVTSDPIVGIVVGALLVLAGLYMVSNGTGTAALFGWLFLVVGALSVVGNLVLRAKTRR
jgi:hypothetical protein